MSIYQSVLVVTAIAAMRRLTGIKSISNLRLKTIIFSLFDLIKWVKYNYQNSIKNNVNGWVKNLENSQVEILLEGEETDVNSVVDWCRNGPANSRVDKIEINQQIFVGELLNFEVLY